MKKLIFFLSFLGTSLFAQNMDEIVNNYLEKTKLKDAIDNIEDFQCNRSFKSNSNSDYTEQISINIKDNKYFKKKSILERDFFYILNNGAGFIKIPMGSRDKAPTYSIKDFSEKEKADYQAEITDGLLPFYKYIEKGYKLIAVANVTVGNESYEKVSLEKGILKREYFFDAKTGLLKRESYTLNGITHSIVHEEYKETQKGFYLPAESVYSNSKDNKNLKLSTTWEFEKPLKGGVSFTK